MKVAYAFSVVIREEQFASSKCLSSIKEIARIMRSKRAGLFELGAVSKRDSVFISDCVQAFKDLGVFKLILHIPYHFYVSQRITDADAFCLDFQLVHLSKKPVRMLDDVFDLFMRLKQMGFDVYVSEHYTDDGSVLSGEPSIIEYTGYQLSPDSSEWVLFFDEVVHPKPED